MKFKLQFTEEADDQLTQLEQNRAKKGVIKQIKKVLGYMETNLKHPSLKTHKFDEIPSPFGGDVFETYAQNKTPGAYRIFWVYGPLKGEITILTITPHP